MNGKRLFRKYAQSLGKQAKSFVRIDNEWYSNDTLVTIDNNNNIETTTIDYKEMVHWIISQKTDNL